MNAKRLGVRNASSALAAKPAHSTNFENFVSHPNEKRTAYFPCVLLEVVVYSPPPILTE